MRELELSESEIQIQIVEYLSLIPNIVYFSVPNELAGKLTGAQLNRMKKHVKMGLKAGTADLIIGHKGRMFCMEVKTPKGRQSDNQKDFMKDVYKAGCEYALIRSFESAVDTLRIWGIV